MFYDGFLSITFLPSLITGSNEDKSGGENAQSIKQSMEIAVQLVCQSVSFCYTTHDNVHPPEKATEGKS